MVRVSVIIATYNRVDLLYKALDSILLQKLKKDVSFEILVIDNASSDETAQMIRAISDLSKVHVRYIHESKRGKGFALNRGIREAQGDILIFTDDDIVADSRWLANMVECFETYQCDCVGGRVLPDYPPQAPQWIIENSKLLVGPIVSYDYGEETKVYQNKVMFEFLGANFAFKKSVFNELGEFLTDIGPGKTMMGEDTEMVSRLLKEGKKLYYCGEALVWHPVDPKRMTLKYIARWNVCLGIYRVVADEKSMPSDLKYIFGFPSYLLKVMAKQIGLLFVFVLDRSKFLKIWIELFINIGKTLQIREFYFKLEQGASRHELFCQCNHLHV